MKKVKNIKKSKSYSYILPMLMHEVPGIKRSLSQLENVFIADESYPFFDSNIFLLYEFTGEMWFLEFEEVVKGFSLHELTEDKDKFHVMMVFKVPPEYKKDYELFKQSKYSKMSKEYKETIQKFHSLHKDHPIMDVLYGKERAYALLEEKLNVKIPREQEASSVLNMKDETYDDSMKTPDPMNMNWDLKV
jgi:hypothetical protein